MSIESPPGYLGILQCSGARERQQEMQQAEEDGRKGEGKGTFSAEPISRFAV